MMWRKIFGARSDTAGDLYAWIVKQARREHFYQDFNVPDTVDGRFDMIVLHMFLVQERLQKEAPDHQQLQQDLTDTFFKDMDRSLREMGVGDLSVGKKVRKMAEACYGRLQAYTKAVAEGEKSLEAALARNIFAAETTPSSVALANWVLAARMALADISIGSLISGEAQLP